MWSSGFSITWFFSSYSWLLEKWHPASCQSRRCVNTELHPGIGNGSDQGNCLGAWVLPLTWKGNIPPWSSTAQALHLHQCDFLAEYTANCCCKILEAARSNNCKLAPDQGVCRSFASNKITRRSQLTTVLRTLLPGLRRTRTYLPAAFSVHHTRKPFLHSETQNGQCEKSSILGYNNNRTNKLGHVERFHKR